MLRGEIIWWLFWWLFAFTISSFLLRNSEEVFGKKKLA
jgi:hypothetical protein